jgi:hypothetical protein
MDSTRRTGAACIAIMTVLAMLLAPYCGRICSASGGCGNGAATGESVDSCHHAAVANGSGSITDLASAKPCNQRGLLAVINVEQKPSSLLSVSTSSVLPSEIQQTNYSSLTLISHSARWRNNGDPPQTSLPPTTTSILRI